MSTSSHPERRRPIRLSIAGVGLQGVRQLRPGPPKPSRTYLSTHELLHDHPRLTDQDRQQLKAFLEGRPRMLTYTPNVRHRRGQLDAVIATIPEKLASIYRTRSSASLIGLDALGTKLFEIRPGSIHLRMGIDGTIMEFSTTHWRTERQPRQQSAEPVTLCAVHYLQLPASGVCDFCV